MEHTSSAQSQPVHPSDNADTQLAPPQLNAAPETQHDLPVRPMPVPESNYGLSDLYLPEYSSALDPFAFNPEIQHTLSVRPLPILKSSSGFPSLHPFDTFPDFNPPAFNPSTFNPSTLDPLAFNPPAFDPLVFDPTAFGAASFDFGHQADHEIQPRNAGPFWNPWEENAGRASHDSGQLGWPYWFYVDH